MVVTEKIIKNKFNEYNKLYFNSELPKCKCKTIKSYKYLGYFSFRKNKWGRKKITCKTLEVSEYFDWDEKTLKNVIIHEMVHYYLAYKFHLIDEQLNHGKDFIEYINFLNGKYNLNITVTIDTNSLKLTSNASKFKWWLTKMFFL